MVTVIKIGGSVLTKKGSSFGQLRRKHLAGIARTVQRHISQQQRNGQVRLILLLGVGSFGHPLAKKYGVTHGVSSGKTSFQKWRGALLTHNEILKLLQQTAEIFLEAGVPVCPVSPLNVLPDGTMGRGFSRLIQGVLDRGLVPLLHGDTVFDGAAARGGKGGSGVKILSSDEIAVFLANELKANELCFLTRGGGLKLKGKPVEKISAKELQKLLPAIKPDTPYDDVTRGFSGKIQALLKSRVPVRICNGSRLSDVEQGLLHGKGGTLVVP